MTHQNNKKETRRSRITKIITVYGNGEGKGIKLADGEWFPPALLRAIRRRATPSMIGGYATYSYDPKTRGVKLIRIGGK